MTTFQNVSFTLGEDWELSVSLNDETGQPLTNIDAVEYRLSNSRHRYVLKTLGSGISLLNSAAAIIVSTADQATIPAGLYKYEVYAHTTAGDDSIQAAGTWAVAAGPKSQFP